MSTDTKKTVAITPSTLSLLFLYPLDATRAEIQTPPRPRPCPQPPRRALDGPSRPPLRYASMRHLGLHRGLASQSRPRCHPLVLQVQLLTLTCLHSRLHPPLQCRRASPSVLSPCAVLGPALILISHPRISESRSLDLMELSLTPLPMTLPSSQALPPSLPHREQSALRRLGFISPPSLRSSSIISATCGHRNSPILNRLHRATPAIHMGCQPPLTFVQSRLSQAIPLPQPCS